MKNAILGILIILFGTSPYIRIFSNSNKTIERNDTSLIRRNINRGDLVKSSKPDSGIYYYQKAISILDKNGKNDRISEYYFALAHLKLASLYVDIHQADNANKHNLIAYSIATKIHSKELICKLLINKGTIAFYIKLYVDCILEGEYYNDDLLSGYYTYVEDLGIGKLSRGAHIIKILKDEPNLISETNDLDNEYIKTINVLTTDIKNFNINNISIYPNPSTGLFKVSGVKDFIILNIFKVEGHLILSQKINYEETVDISSFPTGIYFLYIETMKV